MRAGSDRQKKSQYREVLAFFVAYPDTQMVSSLIEGHHQCFLDSDDIFRLGAFLALCNGKFNGLAFGQGLEA